MHELHDRTGRTRQPGVSADCQGGRAVWASLFVFISLRCDPATASILLQSCRRSANSYRSEGIAAVPAGIARTNSHPGMPMEVAEAAWQAIVLDLLCIS